ASRLDQDQVELGEQAIHLGDGQKVDRGVLADRSMRAPAGFDPADPFCRQRAASRQEFGVLAGVDVVGDRGDFEPAAHLLAQPVHQRGLTRPDGTADPDAQWVAHERNSLVYWVSCAIDARSTAKVTLPNASGPRSAAAVAAAVMTDSSAANMR